MKKKKISVLYLFSILFLFAGALRLGVPRLKFWPEIYDSVLAWLSVAMGILLMLLWLLQSRVEKLTKKGKEKTDSSAPGPDHAANQNTGVRRPAAVRTVNDHQGQRRISREFFRTFYDFDQNGVPQKEEIVKYKVSGTVEKEPMLLRESAGGVKIVEIVPGESQRGTDASVKLVKDNAVRKADFSGVEHKKITGLGDAPEFHINHITKSLWEPGNKNGKHLAVGQALTIDNNDGSLREVKWEDLCWKKTLDDARHTEIYIQLQRNRGIWHAYLWDEHQDQQQAKEVKLEGRLWPNEYPEMFYVWVQRGDGEEQKLTCLPGDRVCVSDKNQYILEYSGYYPTQIVALVGSVSSGKTWFAKAMGCPVKNGSGEEAASDMARKQFEKLGPYAYQGPFEDPHYKLPDGNGHTQTVGALALRVIDTRLEGDDSISYIYIIDQPGERLKRLNSGNANNSMTARSELEAIFKVSNAVVTILDQDTLNGKEEASSPKRLWNLVSNPGSNQERIFVCTKSDEMEKHCREIGGGKAICADSMVFKTSQELLGDKLSPSELIYKHIAVATDTFRRCEFFGTTNNQEQMKNSACFIVSSGVNVGDHQDANQEKNVELVLAYLIQQLYGTRLA